jgi:hypothetical protein
MIDQQINSSILQQPYELSIKKLKTDFTETMDNKVVSCIFIKQVYNCQLQFTETNFTAIFYTKFENYDVIFSIFVFFYSDEHFLQQNSIPSKTPIKLFVRVKERIKPDQCSFRVTSTFIEITLTKDNEHGIPWNRLEPNEYSESRPIAPSSPPSTLPLSITSSNSVMNNFNRGKI